MLPPKYQLATDFLVILLLAALIPVMIWVIWTAPIITTTTTYVVPGVTAAATLLTAAVKGRIQHGWIRKLEAPLRRLLLKPEDTSSSTLNIEALNKKWRRVLGINNVADKLTPNWIMLSFLPCTLLMTAIVTTFTPTVGQRVVEYRPLIPGSKYMFTTTPDTEACAGVAANQEAKPRHAYPWPLKNGNVFFAAYDGDCTASRVLSHVSNINSLNPDIYTYVDAGVAVHRIAMGASALLYRGQAFRRLSKAYGQSLKSTSQCVPVMTSNPVSCKKGKGTLRRMDKHNYLELKVDLGQHKVTRPVGFARNFSHDSAMVNYLWGDADTKGEVGNAFVVFSAYNSPTGAGLFAKDLARTFNDPDEDAGTEPASTYIVTCTITPQNVFAYRRVTLNLQASGAHEGRDIAEGSSALQYSHLLEGVEPCVPEKESVGYLHHTAVALAQYKMVMENFGLDGHFSTVFRIAGVDRKPPYAFNQSRNGLEDALGVISALGVANLRVVGENGVAADAADERAEAVVDVRQLGYGNRVVLLLIIPPLMALIFLVYFFYMSFREQCKPGGGVLCVEGQRRPDDYAGESIVELVTTRCSDDGVELRNNRGSSNSRPTYQGEYQPLVE